MSNEMVNVAFYPKCHILISGLYRIFFDSIYLLTSSLSAVDLKVAAAHYEVEVLVLW